MEAILEKYPYIIDSVAKKIFSIEEDSRKRFTSVIIADALECSVKDVYDNLKVLPDEVAESKDNVQAETDLMFYKEENDGKILINFEFNYARSKELENKNNNYAFLLAIRNIKKASNYSDYNFDLQINFDAFDYLGKNDYKYDGIVMDKKYKVPFDSVKLEIVHYNLDYFKSVEYNDVKEDEVKAALYLISKGKDEELDPDFFKGDYSYMKDVKDAADDYMNSIDFKLHYDKEELQKRVYKEIYTKEGIEIGESNKQLEIAKNMLSKNYAISSIVDITGLTLDEVEKLKENK